MPARRRPPVAALVLLGGLAAAGALLLAAWSVDGRDAEAAARGRSMVDLRSFADRVQLRWKERLLDVEDPLPSIGRAIELDAGASFPSTWPPAAPAPADEPVPSFATLLDAALAASGEETPTGPARALLVLDEALACLDEDDRPPRLAEALVAGLRWSLALDAPEITQRFERRIAELPAGARSRGIDARVLALLVLGGAGADVSRAVPAARAALVSGAGLPRTAPRDELLVDDRRGLVFRGDPEWEALATRAREIAPEVDWDAAFRRPERLRRAALGLVPDAQSDAARWGVMRRSSLLLLHRKGRLIAARVESLLTELDDWPMRGGDWLDLSLASSTDGPHGLTFTLDRAEVALTARDPHVEHEVSEARAGALRLRRGFYVLAALAAAASLLMFRTLRRARRLDELRSTFVASVSHDLRTPLASMLLLVDNLESGRVAGDAARVRYFGALRQEGQRLERLVADLLDVSRIDRGQGPRVSRARVDAETFLDELERGLVERGTRDGAHVSVTRGPCPRELDADSEAIRRAIWNLFENALRHGQRPGASEPVTVRVAVEVSDGTLVASVSDNGPGIPAKHRETIFEPYERLADRRSRASLMDDTGTGLGLSIVRAIARAHGGDATLADSENGASFRVSFDVLSEEGAA